MTTTRTNSRSLPWGALRMVCLVGVLALACGADEAAINTQKAAQGKLAPLQVYVGQWRGVGQPKRGSTADNWIENSAWRWDFKGDDSSLVLDVKEPRFYSQGRLKAGDKEGEFTFIGTIKDSEEQETFTGTLKDGRLVFERAEAAEGRPARITLRTAADGARLMVLFESRRGTANYNRLAEVGYTREGSGFGQGGSGPECVVTGGYGTIAVSYQGKAYYVCCSGCKDLFDENPAKVLAEYKERKAKEREAKSKK